MLSEVRGMLLTASTKCLDAQYGDIHILIRSMQLELDLGNRITRLRDDAMLHRFS